VADSPISGNGLTIQQLFAGRRFRLGYYQREYSWSRESVKLLLDDLQRRFLACWHEVDDRQATARYEPYFLGPFVYHEEEGITYLVDGQQRITTLHLLLIYLYRLLRDQGLDADASELQPLIFKRQRGTDSFTIDIEERHDLLDALLQDRPYTLPVGHSPSLQNLYERSRDIDELFPEELRGDALPYFYDWLLDRVCLVGIKALSRDNAWEIFESMNDRGVRLGPVDLLKSHLLSRVDSSEQKRLNVQWREMLSRLNGLDQNAASDFVKTILAAYYSRDSLECIELRSASISFHEWVRRNEERLFLKTHSDFARFIDRLAKLSISYTTIAGAGRVFQHAEPRLHAIFYNQYNNLGIQLPMIFATIAQDDQPSDVKAKAGLIANFVDLVYVRSMINNAASITRLEEDLSELVPRLRNCHSQQQIADLLADEIGRLPYSFNGIEKFGLHQNVRQVRYLLARLTAYVDTQSGYSNEIAEYLNEQEPYEIEHIWPDDPRYRGGLKSVPEFKLWRNRLGALLLLPKSVNASLRDMAYEEKIKQYLHENRLAASLHGDSHGRRGNPGFTKFLRKNDLSQLFRPFPTFGATSITVRQKLYERLCELIWSPEELGIPIANAASHTEPPSRRPRTRYGVELSDLIDVGLLETNTSIFGWTKKIQYEAVVLPDGRVTVESGETFGSLSAAGQFVRGTKSCQGWSFWHIRRDDGYEALADIRKNALENGLLEARHLSANSVPIFRTGGGGGPIGVVVEPSAADQ
jgi:hypothetical protein